MALCLAMAGCNEGPAAAEAAPISPNATHVRCVNTVSGAGWTLALDHAHGLADGRPARFDAHRAVWTDAARTSVYDLDLQHGALTITRGSSTGGWVAAFACRA